MTRGPSRNEDCCVTLKVDGGTYNRLNNMAYPATVSAFNLDRFEATVGRFRKFLNAYPGNKPAAGAGAHPKLPNSGWDPTWSVNLPATKEALAQAIQAQCVRPEVHPWTDTPGPNEDKPMTCLTWFEAFSFCAWDGGRLPTEAEWNYAAAGGAEQRTYPWPGTDIDSTYAVYDCFADGSARENCMLTDIPPVGSRSPKGDGKWQQADLGGSVWEWMLDVYSSEWPLPCNDCAILALSGERVLRSGAWLGYASDLSTEYTDKNDPALYFIDVGVRCVRDLP
jgi:formylglycine-generating enzyme required for sulfatase activity